MITFAQLQKGPVARASGLSVTSQDFLNYCNGAVRQLMTRGDFWSNVAAVECCVRTNGMLVWPRGVSTILALNVCGNSTEMQNRWHRFRPLDNQHYDWGMEYQRNGRMCGDIVTETNGSTPVFNQICGTGFTIRTFVSQPTDVGKTITWYGIDGNGQVVRTQRSDGTFQDGIQLTLAMPFVDTPIQFQKVTRCVKSETDGYLNCYQYNVAQGFLLDLAQYQPSETNPDYIATRITGRRGHFSGCGNLQRVSALVKLKFIPFKYPDDLVQIDNEDAIRDMFLSIQYKEDGNIAEASNFEASAIHELNLESASRMPDEQIVFENQTFGTSDIGRRRLY